MAIVKKYWWALVIAALAGLVIAMNHSLKDSRANLEESNASLKRYQDSIAVVMEKDSTEYCRVLTELDSERTVYKTRMDSLNAQLSLAKKSSKVYTKTVYKDSIKEVYIENDELVVQFQQTIKQLTDSLSKQHTTVVHDTVTVTKVVTDSSATKVVTVVDSVKTEVVKNASDPKFAVYGEGVGKYNGEFGWSAELGGKYFFLGPVYGKAAVTYDGGLGGEVGLGAEFRF